MSIRILITGSRTWTDDETIASAITAAYDWAVSQHHVLEDGEHPELNPLIVSGACPRGADRLAEEWAGRVHWPVERHPADWNQHGKQAGFVRNAEMVALGADVCLAFIKDGSKGATMTADLADRAGIPTRRYTA